jgi:molybdopterin synthase catalytic subunit
MAFLSDHPLELDPLVAAVTAPDRGAVATFTGVVRNIHAGREVVELEYSAYGPMAEAECARIVAETEARWPCTVALRHRVGRLDIGEPAVVIAVGSGHRAEAFEACRHVLEEVKRRVPIWKRERYGDGTEAWVDPTPAAGVVPAERGTR